MANLHVDVWLTKDRRPPAIRITRDSMMTLEIQMCDHEVPSTASIMAYASGRYNKTIFKAPVRWMSSSMLQLDIPEGFFVPGKNDLQIEIKETATSNPITLPIDVDCAKRVQEGATTATPEAVLPMVERAESAATSASGSAAEAQRIADSISPDYPTLVSEVRELKEDLAYFLDIPKWESGYISKYGVVSDTDSTTRFNSSFISCIPGSEVFYKAESDHSSVSAISFWDKDKQFIAGKCNVGSITDEHSATVPFDAAYIRLSINKSKQSDYYVRMNEPFIKLVNDNIASIEHKFDIISKIEVKYQKTEGTLIKYDTGATQSNSSYDLITLSVPKCKIFKVRIIGSVTNSSAGIVLFNDTEKVYAEKWEARKNDYVFEIADDVTIAKITIPHGGDFEVYSYAEIDGISKKVDALNESITRIPFDYDSDGGYINASGIVQPHSSYTHTDYVKVKAFSSISFPAYFLTGAKCVFYDDDYSPIPSSVITNTTLGELIHVDIPDNYSYMRCSVNKSYIDSFYISFGDSLAEIAQKLSSIKGDDSVPLSIITHDGGFSKIFRTIGVIGDSLASGEMAYSDSEDESTRHYIDMYDYSWIQYMARYCGNTAYNFSVGGMNTSMFRSKNDQYNDFVNPDKKCQAYFIALGHNDYNKSIDVGTIDDVKTDYNTNAKTFYGNYDWIINEVKRIQPKAKIFLITMKKDSVYGAYNSSIRALSERYENVYLIDMATYSPILEDWEYTKGHGNTMGYLNYSYQISSYVDWIIRHNKDAFKFVQFIGTDLE